MIDRGGIPVTGGAGFIGSALVPPATPLKEAVRDYGIDYLQPDLRLGDEAGSYVGEERMLA